MPIEIGAIIIDDEAAIRQFKQDLRDDWFPDPRRFEDIFDQSLIQALISANCRQNGGTYKASARKDLNIPKPNFTLRTALETSVPDRVVYHALVASIVPYFDPLIPWQIYSHRYNDVEAKKYLFKRGVKSWSAFSGVCRSQLTEGKVLLSTDLSNYFENIDIQLLREALIRLLDDIRQDDQTKKAILERINLLFSCLEAWCYRDARYGLPQNRDASSFLANVYMLVVDRSMLSRGYQYYRYMDDIKIVCDDHFHARMALKDLSIQLRNIGLSINAKKTVICDAHDTKSIGEHLDTLSPELSDIESMWETKKVSIIKKSFAALRDQTVLLLEDGKIDSREFRFCIARMEALAQCDELAIPATYFAPVTPLIVNALTIQPSATDQLVRFLRLVVTTDEDLARIGEYLMDARRSIYTWQNYRLWVLLAQKNYASRPLLHHAMSILKSSGDTPHRSGATIYLGAVGGTDERMAVAENFCTLETFMGQRHALLAVQELNYADQVEKPVKPHVRPDLHGVYRGLQQARGYFAPPERRSIAWIIDNERSYA